MPANEKNKPMKDPASSSEGHKEILSEREQAKNIPEYLFCWQWLHRLQIRCRLFGDWHGHHSDFRGGCSKLCTTPRAVAETASQPRCECQLLQHCETTAGPCPSPFLYRQQSVLPSFSVHHSVWSWYVRARGAADTFLQFHSLS